MKISLISPLLALMLTLSGTVLLAQNVKESVQPISKKSQKGFMDETTIADNGKISILYKIGGDKKKNELFYEEYSFDTNLKFLEAKDVNEPKIETQPDKEVTYMGAWVGGSSSFDVLSMKLRVSVTKAKQVWDYKRQRYVTDKILSDETVKLKNADGKNYYGVQKYRNEDGDFIVLAYTETKDKKSPRQYVLLKITFDGEVTEKPIDINGAYSMVYCSEITEEAAGKPVGKQDFVIVLAPKEGAADLTNYVYLHYNIKGTLKNKLEFKSPSSNLLINSVDVKNGEVYFSGLSTKSKDAYGEVFEDYIPMENPYFTGENQNYQMEKYAKAAKEEMDNFHLLKFSGNQLVFATTATIDDFKAKKKTAPSEKSGKVYTGKKFVVSTFEVTPANEYLITGQLMSRIMMDKNAYAAYGDIVCLHFDSKGILKSQYAVDKIFEDKKSEIFDMPQRFYVSGDGKYAYWEILEVKGVMGYAGFSDAYNGRKTFYPMYFPRITKINLETGTLSDFKIPGDKKFFMYRDGYYFNPTTQTRTFIGRDEDGENLWVSKVSFDPGLQ